MGPGTEKEKLEKGQKICFTEKQDLKDSTLI